MMHFRRFFQALAVVHSSEIQKFVEAAIEQTQSQRKWYV